MAIQNAINFLFDIDKDEKLRSTFNLLQGAEVETKRNEMGYKFSPEEFEETINFLHVKCQHEEQANHLFQLVSWYKMISANV